MTPKTSSWSWTSQCRMAQAPPAFLKAKYPQATSLCRMGSWVPLSATICTKTWPPRYSNKDKALKSSKNRHSKRSRRSVSPIHRCFNLRSSSNSNSSPTSSSQSSLCYQKNRWSSTSSKRAQSTSTTAASTKSDSPWTTQVCSAETLTSSRWTTKHMPLSKCKCQLWICPSIWTSSMRKPLTARRTSTRFSIKGINPWHLRPCLQERIRPLTSTELTLTTFQCLREAFNPSHKMNSKSPIQFNNIHHTNERNATFPESIKYLEQQWPRREASKSKLQGPESIRTKFIVQIELN